MAALENNLAGDRIWPAGSPVRVHGVRSATALNGLVGSCEGVDRKTGLVHVRLPKGERRAFKPRNLWKVVAEAPADDHPDPDADKLKHMLRVYDSSGNGVLEPEQFKLLLHSLDVDPECMPRFAKCTGHVDGCPIYYEGFVDWMFAESAPPLLEDSAAQASPDNDEAHVEVDADEDDDDLDMQDLTTSELDAMCFGLPYGWQDKSIRVVNTVRRRFPDVLVQRIVQVMRQQNFHGGNVVVALRRQRAKEVLVPLPIHILHDASGRRAFPATYAVREGCAELLVYDSADPDFSFDLLRRGRLAPVGSLLPGHRVEVLEARRELDINCVFGRIRFSASDDAQHWVQLGRDLDAFADHQCGDLHFSMAERLPRGTSPDPLPNVSGCPEASQDAELDRDPGIDEAAAVAVEVAA